MYFWGQFFSTRKRVKCTKFPIFYPNFSKCLHMTIFSPWIKFVIFVTNMSSATHLLIQPTWLIFQVRRGPCFGKYRRGQGTGVGQFSYVGHVGNVGQGWTLHFAPSFYSAQVILLTLTFYWEGKLLDKFIGLHSTRWHSAIVESSLQKFFSIVKSYSFLVKNMADPSEVQRGLQMQCWGCASCSFLWNANAWGRESGLWPSQDTGGQVPAEQSAKAAHTQNHPANLLFVRLYTCQYRPRQKLCAFFCEYWKVTHLVVSLLLFVC